MHYLFCFVHCQVWTAKNTMNSKWTVYIHICTEYERDMKILIDLKLISFVIEPTKLIKFVISLPVNCLIVLKVTTHVQQSHYHINAKHWIFIWKFDLTWNCFALIINMKLLNGLDIRYWFCVLYIPCFQCSILWIKFDETRAKYSIHI